MLALEVGWVGLVSGEWACVLDMDELAGHLRFNNRMFILDVDELFLSPSCLRRPCVAREDRLTEFLPHNEPLDQRPQLRPQSISVFQLHHT
jgi:hypothetical protein